MPTFSVGALILTSLTLRLYCPSALHETSSEIRELNVIVAAVAASDGLKRLGRRTADSIPNVDP
jgi:hypothetical protein